ncbi:unnamed protein product [Tenebrio molitor]|nr:unnamed protein product [Tenebrio molitor]
MNVLIFSFLLCVVFIQQADSLSCYDIHRTTDVKVVVCEGDSCVCYGCRYSENGEVIYDKGCAPASYTCNCTSLPHVCYTCETDLCNSTL